MRGNSGCVGSCVGIAGDVSRMGCRPGVGDAFMNLVDVCVEVLQLRCNVGECSMM